MKRYQFEEIAAGLSIIIAVLAYQNGIKWLSILFVIKSALDLLSVIHYAIKSNKKPNPKEGE